MNISGISGEVFALYLRYATEVRVVEMQDAHYAHIVRILPCIDSYTVGCMVISFVTEDIRNGLLDWSVDKYTDHLNTVHHVTTHSPTDLTDSK